MRDTIRQAASASRYLLAGGATAVGTLWALTLIGMMIGLTPPIGLLLLPIVIMTNRWIADIERRRAGALLGEPVERSYPALFQPDGRHGPLAARRTPGSAARRWLEMTVRALTDRSTYRDAVWVVVHTALGTLLAGLTIALWAWLVTALTLPLWWAARPPGMAVGWVAIVAPAPLAAAALLWAVPLLATAEARLAATMLAQSARHRLTARISELTRSRAEALDAHSAELRRIERDLHDGVQAQLVSVALLLGVVERRLGDNPAVVPALVRQAREGAEAALGDLRDLVRGMYPPILADRGLEGAIGALAARGPVPVAVEVRSVGRLPAAVEAAAYLTIAEALTNVARHSGAERASVTVRRHGDSLTINVWDDGRGGADETRGSGLPGIRGRIAAFDGRVELHSPPGGPTSLYVELPCGS